MVTSNIHPKIDLNCIPSLFSLGIFDQAAHILNVIHIAAEILPSRLLDEVIIMCILGKLYQVIVPNHLQGISSDGPIYPTNQDFIA